MSDFQHTDNGITGKFFLEQDGEIVAELRYVWVSKRLAPEQTLVNKKLSGQGYGKMLIKKLVEYAREKQVLIMPVCPFAKKVLESDPANKDILFVP
jgi:uncharacterized protein